ncbi:hypothetical protein LMG28727_06710 [Paraburkholderia kirstenboschensis]|nr:hypothetical protein [Paraburkholderia kirstenboschensis]CAD6558768.1 hypothetical protein LMG28727_06710 [Paraburkholderia kirstenboschensis]
MPSNVAQLAIASSSSKPEEMVMREVIDMKMTFRGGMAVPL